MRINTFVPKHQPPVLRRLSFGSNSFQVRKHDDKHVIDNLLGEKSGNFEAGKKNYSLNYQNGLYMVSTGNNQIGTIRTSQHFAKTGVQIGFEVQEEGKAEPVLRITRPSQTKKGGEQMLIKLHKNAEMTIRPKNTMEYAEIKIGEVEKYQKARPSFSGYSRIVNTLAIKPEATIRVYENFKNHGAQLLCDNETQGAFATSINRDNYTVANIIGGAGKRFSPLTSPTINKPATPACADEVSMADISAFTTIVDGGLADKTDFNATNLRENKKLGTAGGLVTALQKGIISPDRHLVILSGDQLHNIDISRAIHKFEEDQNTGIMVITTPIEPAKTLDKFGLVSVSPDSFEESINDLAKIKGCVEKPSDLNLATGAAVRVQGQEGEKALASTGSYIIHKDVLKLFMHMARSEESYDFGKQFLPTMRVFLNETEDITKEKLIETVKTVESRVTDANLEERIPWIQEKIRDEDVQRVRGLKMKAWIGQDNRGNIAKWADVGNMPDYHETMLAIGKPDKGNDWQNFSRYWLDKVKGNTDNTTGVVCQTDRSKEAFKEFMRDFDVKARGTILVMTEP